MVSIPLAVISAAQSAQHTTAVPASVTIAQWEAESAWGTKYTGTWNCFGIKAVPGQSATACKTHEVIGGMSIPTTAMFANYASLDDAFEAHGRLISGEAKFAPAMALLPDVTAFVNAMAPIYATDPTYAHLLLEIIAEHHLEQYDMESA